MLPSLGGIMEDRFIFLQQMDLTLIHNIRGSSQMVNSLQPDLSHLINLHSQFMQSMIDKEYIAHHF
jgi:hypothetical protein